MSELVPVAILYLVIIIFIVLIYLFLGRRKKKHAERYEGDIQQFVKAISEKNIAQISFYGDRIIWNEHLEQSDKKMLYESLESIHELHPALEQLWKDVHYKIHGYEPYEVPPDNYNSRWSSTRDSIIDSPEDLLDR